VPHARLTHPRRLGKGAFGDVDLAEYVLTVAVKCSGTTCADAAAIGNERRLYDKLLLHPHDNILPVFGICTDAPDGKVRLVMKYCEKGSLDDYLTATARLEVCFVGVLCHPLFPRHFCPSLL
jgi:serine/threonine protein kinase